jgi:hypothetical protein
MRYAHLAPDHLAEAANRIRFDLDRGRVITLPVRRSTGPEGTE